MSTIRGSMDKRIDYESAGEDICQRGMNSLLEIARIEAEGIHVKLTGEGIEIKPKSGTISITFPDEIQNHVSVISSGSVAFQIGSELSSYAGKFVVKFI